MIAIRLVLVSALCAGLASPTWADNDKNKGKGNDNDRGQSQGNRGDKGNDNRGNDRATVSQTPTRVVVTDRDRTTVYTYYRTEFTSGNCPPGLAKKNNGCLPPGQAKKLYREGQRYPLSYGKRWSYDQIPYEMRRDYGFDQHDRYYHGDGYIYRVDPKTMLIEQVVRALIG